MAESDKKGILHGFSPLEKVAFITYMIVIIGPLFAFATVDRYPSPWSVYLDLWPYVPPVATIVAVFLFFFLFRKSKPEDGFISRISLSIIGSIIVTGVVAIVICLILYTFIKTTNFLVIKGEVDIPCVVIELDRESRSSLVICQDEDGIAWEVPVEDEKKYQVGERLVFKASKGWLGFLEVRDDEKPFGEKR